MDQTPQRAFDIEPTVQRLHDDVTRWVKAHRTAPTAEVLTDALRDLTTLPPWDTAGPDGLARDFLATVERLDPATRNVVRLTLGLDEADKMLTKRRAPLLTKKAGGSAHKRNAKYAFTKALVALLIWRGGPPAAPLRERSLAGFVIRDISVAVLLDATGLDYSVKVVAERYEEDAQAVLVPVPGNLKRLGKFTMQTWRDGVWEETRGEPLGSFALDDSNGHSRLCYVVPLAVRGVDRVEVDLTPSKSEVDDRAQEDISAVWWHCFGTEGRVHLRFTAPAELAGLVVAGESDIRSEADYQPGTSPTERLLRGEDIGAWSTTHYSPDPDCIITLEWNALPT